MVIGLWLGIDALQPIGNDRDLGQAHPLRIGHGRREQPAGFVAIPSRPSGKQPDRQLGPANESRALVTQPLEDWQHFLAPNAQRLVKLTSRLQGTCSSSSSGGTRPKTALSSMTLRCR